MSPKASSNGSRRRNTPKRVSVTIRLPDDIVARIDQDLGGRDVPLSRNNWLLEAAIEKLRRSETEGSHGAK
jgi:predicted transcriptional regulator